MDRPCPIGRLANVPPCQFCRSGTRPSDSPASSMPVRWPRPNFSRYCENGSLPTRWASMRVPTLEDFPKMPVVVYGVGPCCHASETVTPSMRMLPSTECTSSGWVSPASMAAAAVMIFCTEPGSNGEVMAGLPRSAPRSSSAPTPTAGLNVLSLAIARTSPVRASRTTAEALFAPEVSLADWIAFWTCHCRSASRVRRIVSPSRGSVTLRRVPGMTVLSWARSKVCRPSSPSSWSLKWDSMPCRPISLPSSLLVVAPTTLAASAPPGYSRMSTRSAPIIGNFRTIALAWVTSTLRTR